jgi:hypothetical protein
MRILSAPKVQTAKVPGGLSKSQPQAQAKKKIKLSWEDLVLGLAVLVIVVSWIQGVFTPDQVLAYLGFTATGGIWGYFSGKGGNG